MSSSESVSTYIGEEGAGEEGADEGTEKTCVLAGEGERGPGRQV